MTDLPDNFDPGKVMADVERGADRLQKAGSTYSVAVLRFEEAENEYNKQIQTKLIEIFNEYTKADKRAPAEDLRHAMAHGRIDQKVYGEYLTARAEKESMTVLFKALGAEVNARQSILSFLKGMGG